MPSYLRKCSAALTAADRGGPCSDGPRTDQARRILPPDRLGVSVEIGRPEARRAEISRDGLRPEMLRNDDVQPICNWLELAGPVGVWSEISAPAGASRTTGVSAPRARASQ